MKQWNGLAQKEWMLWRWQLLVITVILMVGLFVLPTIVGKIANDPNLVFEMTMVFCFMLAGVGSIIPAIAFATMFNRDMKQPDLWLHSTANMYKLIGVKLFTAAYIGGLALLLPTFVVAIRFAFTDVTIVTFDELAFFGTSFIALLFVASLSIMVVVFFFMVIDRLLKLFLKGFSIVATLIVLVISVRVYGEFVNSNFYERFIQVGKLDLMNFRNQKLEIGNMFFEYTNTTLYIGQMLFDTTFTVGLFLIAIFLFEKKVRV